MKYDFWLYPEANLLVEKFSKIVNLKDFEGFDGSRFAELEKTSDKITSLVDMSDATLFNIKHDEVSKIYKSLVDRIKGNTSMKIAIYNGNNSKDDYLKTSLFTKFENERIQMQNFLDLKEAMNWLELSEDYREKIRVRLMG